MEQTAVLANDVPQLNPQIDRAGLAREFQRQGRVQVQRVLTRSSAQRIHTCLTEETRYNLIVNGAEDAGDLRDPTSQQRQECAKAAWRRVGINGFQFLYEGHTLSLEGESYGDPRHYWARVTAFLNGPDFLDLARQISGMDHIVFADAQATLYRPGHFLTLHDDARPGPNRLLAYVLSFTASWRPEWGGVLQFVGETGQIDAGYVPTFNSLRLFRVPMKHYVSCVAPYAMAGRYAITGWLRTH